MNNQKLRFAFAGDWHGNLEWAVAVVRAIANEGVDTLYQLGDFGLFPGPSGRKYLDRLGRAINEINSGRVSEAEANGSEATEFRLIVVPGNHDDYKRISEMTLDADGWLKLSKPIYENIFFAPRGHTWMESGYRFAALGGAGSVDQKMRTEGTSWWPGEEIQETDCQLLVDNVKAMQWERVDFLLTHEAPAGPHLHSMFDGYNRPAWFTVEIEHYCWTQRVRLRGAVDQIQPKMNLHGHWHNRTRNLIQGVNLDNVEYECHVWGLANEGTRDNFWIPTEDELAVLLN